MTFECVAKTLVGRIQSRIVKRGLDAVLLQNRRRQNRLQRWVWLHFRNLLGVRIEMIAVRQENFSHRTLGTPAEFMTQGLAGEKRSPNGQPSLRNRQKQLPGPSEEVVL